MEVERLHVHRRHPLIRAVLGSLAAALLLPAATDAGSARWLVDGLSQGDGAQRAGLQRGDLIKAAEIPRARTLQSPSGFDLLIVEAEKGVLGDVVLQVERNGR